MVKSEPLLSTREAAELCGVHVATVREWVRNGKLEALQTPGGRLRFDRTVVLQMLARRAA